MITITVLQLDRSETIEGVIATHVVEDADIQIKLGRVLRTQQAISESNGMRLYWEDNADRGVHINENNGLGYQYHGIETDWDGKDGDDGCYVVAVDVRYAREV